MDQFSSTRMYRRKACVSCTVAKVRCCAVTPDLCERCQRLGKDCIYLDATTARRRRKGPSRVQKLEERLEDMISMLGTLTQQAPSPSIVPSSSSDAVSSPGISVEMFRSPNLHLSPTKGSSSDAGAARRLPFSTPATTADEDNLDIIDRGLLSLPEANDLLETFRHEFTPNFPFVVVPPSASAESLRIESPFLFLSIISVTMCQNNALQRFLGMEFKRIVSARLVMQNEKSLDILQALLVHIAWSHYLIRPKKHRTRLLLHFCIALVGDLGIDKSPRQQSKGIVDCGSVEVEPCKDNARASAEKRALLGTYYLSAIVSTIFRKQSAMKYTKHMDRCCQSLTSDRESSSDLWIKPIIQLQVLTRRVSDCFCYEQLEDSEVEGEGGVMMTVESFRRELDQIKSVTVSEASLPANLLLELHLIDTWIHEASLHDTLWKTWPSHFSIDLSSSPPASAKSFSLSRINMLWHVLGAAKSYLVLFLSLRSQTLCCLGFNAWAGVCYSLKVLAKTALLTPESSDGLECQLPAAGQDFGAWNPAMVANEADILSLGRELQERISGITSGLASSEGDTMHIFGYMLKTVVAGCEKRMRDRGLLVDITGEDTAIRRGQKPPEAEAEMTSTGPVAQADINKGDTIGSEVATIFDMPSDLPEEDFEDFIWESIMEDFTMLSS